MKKNYNDAIQETYGFHNHSRSINICRQGNQADLVSYTRSARFFTSVEDTYHSRSIKVLLIMIFEKNFCNYPNINP